MLITVKNLLLNAIKPMFFWVMVSKVLKRFEKRKPNEALQWAIENSSDMDSVFLQIHETLWLEAKSEYARVMREAKPTLSNIKHNLGGGGAFPLLYFLCRLLKPQVVVETGVAAGWSSLAFLSALDKNEQGKLYSSDFPYFRLYRPEQFIGVLVPSKLRKRWLLDVRGDRVAIPNILQKISKVDIFHYDSDKSFSGKSFALGHVKKVLSKKSVIVFDDIQDDTFFRDLTKKNELKYFLVFKFEGKYLGLYSNFNFYN